MLKSDFGIVKNDVAIHIEIENKNMKIAIWGFFVR
jgi:hypothetical protein